MLKKTTLVCFFVVFLFLASGFAQAQLPVFEQTQKEQKTWGSYLVDGIFGVSYLFQDVSGDKNLFQSQFNWDDGINIPQFTLTGYRDPDKSAFLDTFMLDIQGFGAEPYGRAAFRVEKRRVFYLSGGYTERKYFADVASFANPLFDADAEEADYGSFHTWNSKLQSYDLGGRAQLTSWLGLDAFWQRSDQTGDSLITYTLGRNEYPLSEPLSQTSDVFRVGGDIAVKNLLFYRATGILQKFKLEQSTSSPSTPNLGIWGLPSEISSTYLTEHTRKTMADLETTGLEQSLMLNPLPWLSIDAGYTFLRTEGDSSGEELNAGRFILLPYDWVSQVTLMNSGKIKKDLNKGDITLHFHLLPSLRFNAGYDYYQYKIDNQDTLSTSFVREYNDKTYSTTADFAPMIEMKQNRIFADASWNITRRLTAGGGYARTSYDFGLSRWDGDTDSKYDLNSFYASLGYTLSRTFSLEGTIKFGDYDRVFARLIPRKATTAKLQGNFNLLNSSLSGSLYYKYQKLENSDFSYESALNAFGANLQYQLPSKSLGLILHASRNDFDSEMDIFRYGSNFVGIDEMSTYTSELTHLLIGIWYRKGILSFNGGYNYTQIEGTFPITMNFPYATLGVRVIQDFAVTFNYKYYGHEQELYSSQNYKAHIFNIGLMYGF
jgi:hypothetical protein